MPDPKKLCFVLMPFKDEMKEVYWGAIKPACEKAGFASLRVDELKGAFNINKKIIEHIFASEAIVADLTEWNPNVFYEMGVAHAIANKTVTIIQKKDKLPFDVAAYRGIFYEQTAVGLVKLREDIVESLQTIAEWSRHPSNPVQDFKPRDARLEQAAIQVATLQNELAQKQAEIVALQKQIQTLRQPVVHPPPPKLLRSQPLAELSVDAVKKMLKEKDFFDSSNNKQGKGVQHQYEKIEREGQPLVIDHATGLTWQQSGSSNAMTYADAEKYVRDLNAKRFVGFNDWRLPTLEEAMSLMEPGEKNSDLYIDPVFNKTQRWIWTVDKANNTGVAWAVSFGDGYFSHQQVSYGSFVRVVR